MSLFEPKSTTKNTVLALKALVFMAIISELVSPKVAKASMNPEMANSTQKIFNLELTSQDKQENSIKLAFVDQLVEEEKPDKVVRAVITAYTSTPGQTDDSPFIAATGKRVHDGMIAANNMPFGTQIKIPSLYGNKIFVVEDRMNKRYGFGRMDIWLDTTRAEAMKFGVKRVDVEIFYPKKAITRAGR